MPTESLIRHHFPLPARLFALLALLAACAFPAQAQLRTIPADAKRATLRHVHELVVEVDGVQVRLAPGAQIRDASNRVVLPASLPQPQLVRFVADADGRIRQIWILTPEEAAAER